MIAVVYSGSRHADWKLAEKGRIVSEFKTPGINPFFSNENHIVQLLHKSVDLINNAEKINRVYFFGAGASSKERQDIITNALGSFFRFSKIVVDHDLKAAAIAACGDEKGIVGILGSGSNAAYFDGKKINENNRLHPYFENRKSYKTGSNRCQSRCQLPEILRRKNGE